MILFVIATLGLLNYLLKLASKTWHCADGTLGSSIKLTEEAHARLLNPR
jgi:hypothetical protein